MKPAAGGGGRRHSDRRAPGARRYVFVTVPAPRRADASVLFCAGLHPPPPHTNRAVDARTMGSRGRGHAAKPFCRRSLACPLSRHVCRSPLQPSWTRPAPLGSVPPSRRALKSWALEMCASPPCNTLRTPRRMDARPVQCACTAPVRVRVRLWLPRGVMSEGAESR